MRFLCDARETAEKWLRERIPGGPPLNRNQFQRWRNVKLILTQGGGVQRQLSDCGPGSASLSVATRQNRNPASGGDGQLGQQPLREQYAGDGQSSHPRPAWHQRSCRTTQSRKVGCSKAAHHFYVSSIHEMNRGLY